MTGEQLVRRFPQIPQLMYGNPILDRIGATFDAQLQTAHKPSNCSSHQMTADHHVYMKLIAPLEALSFGFLKPENTIKKLEGYCEAYEADAPAFLAEMIPVDAAPSPGGCQGDAAAGHAH